MGYIELVSRDRHRCKPPGIWRRWRDGVDYGTVWRCECGRDWEWAMPWGESAWLLRGRGEVG